jgi:hypothetical protein
MNIPNGSPAVAFPLSRAGASNSGQILGLDHGVLTSSTITKDAEASTIVRIPGTLIGGIIKGLTDTLTAKKGELGASTDVINAQAGVADARAKLIDSQTALAAKRKGRPALKRRSTMPLPVIFGCQAFPIYERPATPRQPSQRSVKTHSSRASKVLAQELAKRRPGSRQRVKSRLHNLARAARIRRGKGSLLERRAGLLASRGTRIWS